MMRSVLHVATRNYDDKMRRVAGMTAGTMGNSTTAKRGPSGAGVQAGAQKEWGACHRQSGQRKRKRDRFGGMWEFWIGRV